MNKLKIIQAWAEIHKLELQKFWDKKIFKKNKSFTMIRITHIKLLENYTIEYLFNNGIKKNIHCLPLIKKFSYIKGIDDLYNVEYFKKVEIGKMGEIYWKNIIKENPTDKSILRDFDISPEFIFNQNCV